MKSVAKTRCSGLWTEAKYNGFIKSALRSASNRWKPKYDAKKAARVGRNAYTCALCQRVGPSRTAHMDHINPVVDPARGFVSWDEYIARLFVEADGYRCLCEECHSKVTGEQRAVRKAHKPK